jgi:hypothetical protein
MNLQCVKNAGSAMVLMRNIDTGKVHYLEKDYQVVFAEGVSEKVASSSSEQAVTNLLESIVIPSLEESSDEQEKDEDYCEDDHDESGTLGYYVDTLGPNHMEKTVFVPQRGRFVGHRLLYVSSIMGKYINVKEVVSGKNHRIHSNMPVILENAGN